MSKHDWQVVADAAYAIDGEPHNEIEFLTAIYRDFGGTEPAAGFEAYAVGRLVEMLLRNRNVDLNAAHSEVLTDEYFGGCPECGKNDGYLNAGKSHWFICHAHKTRWCIGSNLFSTWQLETEQEQRDTFARVADYRKVEPLSAVPSRTKPVPQRGPSPPREPKNFNDDPDDCSPF